MPYAVPGAARQRIEKSRGQTLLHLSTWAPETEPGLLRLTYRWRKPEHPAQKEEDADQRAEQNRNEGRKQQWTSGGRRRRHDRVKQDGNQRGSRKNPVSSVIPNW